MKKFGLLVLLVLLTLFVSNASAIPVGGTPLGDPRTEIFDIGASVVCNVYQYSFNQLVRFVYTYQITNNDDMADISFFSVTMGNPSVSVWSPAVDSDPFGDCIDPAYWGIVNSPLQSVNAVFANSLGNGKTSSTLWFASDTGPGTASGTLFGTAPDGTHVSSIGNLLAPVPEPATFALIGLGALMGLKRKRS